MAQQQNQDTPIIGYQSIQLFKAQTLGIGSYGSVCKAKCNDLLCAAKIIHPTLYDPTAQQQIARHKEHRLPFRRFQQECEFMSAIKHPNIVQYLGTHQDPETGLPVLLMELMDDSLTHFLESSQDAIPYHIQVNFCHDVTLAISYLHSNGILHRDLSSNNVLLYGKVKAKVTDFGMAKLGDANPRATYISLTMVPGTDAYMPPEAVKEQPVYTAKIDCFSIGVLIIQILTRQFPKPGDRLKSIQIDHPQFPSGVAHANIPEIERRKNHISQVDPNHPLLPIALHCLKDSDVERPSAQELCNRVVALKETPQYTESVGNAQESRPERDNTTGREEQIRELQQQIQQKDDIIQQRAQQIQGLQQIIGSQNNRLQEKELTILACQQECQQLRETVRNKTEELQHLTQHLQTSEQMTAQFQKRIHELEQQLNLAKPLQSPTSPPKTRYYDTSSAIDKLELKCRKGTKAPYKMFRGTNAVVNGDIVYIRPGGTKAILAYNSTNDTWNQLPDCPTKYCSLAVVSNTFTTIGGRNGEEVTNQLFSLTDEGSMRWKEVFPPMPTKREQTTSIVVSKGQALVVAGGANKNEETLNAVEVLDVSSKQWSAAVDLPQPLYEASATIIDDYVYMLGGYDDAGPTYLVYKCSLADLFLSCQSRSLGQRLARSLTLTGQARSAVWNKVADLPVTDSTCVILNGRLLAIGGNSCDKPEPTSHICIYNAATNQWEIISNMTVARSQCLAAVLPNNQLMVVGGYTAAWSTNETDSVEMATVV